jgi:filamentous hemagglutinin family protein
MELLMTARFVCVTDASNVRPDAGKRRLLWSCAAAAIAALATQPQTAKAQAAPPGAFRGSIIGDPANVSRGSLTATTETITITAPKATIEWSASQADFLPSGNVATFLGSGVSDFTVLNRINADGQQVQLNGSVLGRLQGSATTPAGKIWFYSPGGILVGATAVFDVGGLVLTANEPVGFADSTSGFGQFSADLESNALVSVAAGAKINATSPDSYVALIAPRVEQHGTVNVNGSAAYVAAQQLTMTVNQGLFDIAVDVGTGDQNGVVHSGTTGGPSSTGTAGDNHRIYMVAVPKNQALTMLLSGNRGFAPASNASVENGRIILSAGYGVSSSTFNRDNLGGATGLGSIAIEGSGLTSTAHSLATGTINANISNGTIKVGVSTFGQLGTGDTGLRDSRTELEAILDGCVCEGWGVGISGTGAWGGANNSSGIANLTLDSHTMTANSVTTIATINGTDLRVTHKFVPSASADLYEVDVSITNMGTAAAGDILYRRAMDWDVQPTSFDEFVTLHGVGASALIGSSDDGFASANPFGTRNSIVEGTLNTNFVDSGPDDHGALFDFSFGSLDPGKTKTFAIFYGASLSEPAALAALGTVGAEVYSFGQSSDNVSGSTANRSTFIFGFGGVGGTPVPPPTPDEPTPSPPPPPATGSESVLGPVGLGGGELGSSDESDEKDGEDSEESAESIAATLGLISTGGLSTEQLIDAPVTSGSDSGQWDANLDLNPGE